MSDTFRTEVRSWLDEHVTGEFAESSGRGGPGDEVDFDLRVRWERVLGEHGWIGVGWPREHGGRGASIDEQVIWAEEYARADAPGRLSHFGENLLAPTLIQFASDEVRRRFLPRIADASERWCQGYSEPSAGSDLANVQTTARLDGDEWVIDGQKVWTSLAHVSHWCFVVVRTEPGSERHSGLSFLLVPMDQPGIEVRPIIQPTGSGEFNEVFFTGARTAADHIVGAPGEGWKVAMGLLGFERGISTLAQQVGFEREFDTTVELARRLGRLSDPTVRQRLATAAIGLRLMRWNGMRWMASSGVPGPEASISKLFWSEWHQRLGELMVDVSGPAGLIGEGVSAVPRSESSPADGYQLTPEQRLFLFTRADTIYAGSSQIQRNVLGERVLGLPR